MPWLSSSNWVKRLACGIPPSAPIPKSLTKKKLEFNAKNLNDFDAIFMFTGGDPEMDAQQKADFLSFIHDDGKG